MPGLVSWAHGLPRAPSSVLGFQSQRDAELATGHEQCTVSLRGIRRLPCRLTVPTPAAALFWKWLTTDVLLEECSSLSLFGVSKPMCVPAAAAEVCADILCSLWLVHDFF